MVGIEFFCILLCHPSHFEVADGEALFFDGIEDSAYFEIAIGFDESECSGYERNGTFPFVFRTCFWCSRRRSQQLWVAWSRYWGRRRWRYLWVVWKDIRFFWGTSVCSSGHTGLWKKYHIDGGILGVVGELVVTDEWCRRVEPLHHEHISIFSHVSCII